MSHTTEMKERSSLLMEHVSLILNNNNEVAKCQLIFQEIIFFEHSGFLIDVTLLPHFDQKDSTATITQQFVLNCLQF